MKIRNNKASILILALWTLVFLTVLAVQIGLIIRQRVSLISRIEVRERLRDVASSGIQKAISALRLDLLRNGGLYTVYGKSYRHHNREIFKDIAIDNGVVQVVYDYTSTAEDKIEVRYGFVDEESKINLNTVDYVTLQRLLLRVLEVTEQESQVLALSVIDWREIGESMPKGFNSDEYYGNLEFPYEKKSAEFELLDELLLVQGFTPDRVMQLKPFVTVFGDGLVNINTAPKEVLMALGLTSAVADKLLQVRQGLDAEEATIDDYIFFKTFDIATEVSAFLELEEGEIRQIDQLNMAGRIKTNSAYFRMEGQASLANRKNTLEVACIYNARDSKIEYWMEK